MGVYTGLLSLAKPIITKGASIAWENREHLGLFFKTRFTKYKDMDIRFSMSGIYKIQIPGTNKYLLVLNRRIPDQLQPVGGAYKRFGDDSLFNKWGYRPDNSRNGLDVDDKSSKDLRFMVKGRYVIEVLNWFDSKQERETEPRREFKEELIDTGILDSDVFNYFDQKHIRRFSKNLVWSDYFTCFEILTYDVFELKPNEEQRRALVELDKQGTKLGNGFAIVSCDDIQQLRLMEGNRQVARIGHHSKLLINQTF
ncbi:hypothetical protein KZP23_21950 [Echinicola marina]|uniref:SMODS-associated NUDIX domain-containing protein n=1 Tax=Echinicola marina TaxID=2859768 RepID=UPI001CF65B2D|nr:hypothetical protein [Echinicola marina]UCS93277.1 hypothetical protein KZP23_21950 [Echinicola marina]